MKFFVLLYVCFTYFRAISQQTDIGMNSVDPSSLFGGYKPTSRRTKRIGIRNSHPIEVTIEQGKAVFAYAKTQVSPAALDVAASQGTLRLPHGFWQSFFPDVVNRSHNRGLEQMYRKAFKFYLRALSKGAVTVCGVMGEFTRGQRRAAGGGAEFIEMP